MTTGTKRVVPKARLDADATAKPKTSIVKRVRESKVMDAVVRPGEGFLRDDETGDVTPLAEVT